ncbi:TPA: hypothetical protein ACJL40_002060, partial [Neisseria meningitidis]
NSFLRFHVLDSRLRGNDEILDYGNLSGMIESIEKSQESIRKNRNPHRVIPAKAGIQKRNATGIYRKKQKPHRRHSRKSGNPDPSARKLTG